MVIPEGNDASNGAALLRSRKGEILAAWERRIRQLPVARDLDRVALLDHLPHMLDRIAEIAEHLERGERGAIPYHDATKHAEIRLGEGFDLTEVVTEFAVLRDCVQAAWVECEEEQGPDVLRILNQAIDRAIGASVDRYVAARDRALQALDRISAAGLETATMDELLQRLLVVFSETVADVDTVAILLRDGDHLVVRAAVGLEGDMGRSFGWGQGFSGRIAADRRPLALRDAATDPLVQSEAIRRRGVRALFGVPLGNGEVIGVAHMGSTTIAEFSEQDRQLFQALASRTTTAIVQHNLRDSAVRRAAELEAVLASITDAVYVGDHTGMKRMNRAALEMLGFDQPADLDRPIAELAAAIDTRYFDTREIILPEEQPFARALAGEPTTREVLVRDVKTGEQRVLRSAAGPVRVDGRIVGAVAINTDITEQKRLVAEMTHAVQVRDDLLAIVSHDLRNPLGVVTMAARTMLKRALSQSESSPDGKYLDVILRATERMGRLIDDLLDVARIRINGLAVDARSEELAPLLTDAVELQRPMAYEKGIELEAELALPAELRVRCDRGRVQQVLSNLLANAVKFCPSGARVVVRARATEREAQVDVADTGPGIPPEELRHVFDAYWSVPRGEKKGTGLGLFIAKAIIDSHGGRLWIDSAVGRGTTLHFTLPRAPDAGAETPVVG